MTRQPPIPVQRGVKYHVHATDEFDRAIIDQYKVFYNHPRYKEGYADQWLDSVKRYVKNLETPRAFGATDPERFSDKYAHQRIPDTKTIAFYLVEGDQIYLATAGYEGRDWPRVMEKAKPEIERQIDVLKQGSAVKQPASRYDAGAALKRIEADKKNNPPSPDRGDPSDRSDRD